MPLYEIIYRFWVRTCRVRMIVSITPRAFCIFDAVETSTVRNLGYH